MAQVTVRGCTVLFLSFLLVLPLGLQAAENPSGPPEETTNTDQYLNQSLDTPLNEGDEGSDPELSASFENESSGTSMTWFFLKVVLGLGVILGAIWLISKVIERSGMAGTGNDVMGIRSTLTLGQNQYLQIVQIGPRYFMLGVTENNITKLEEIKDTDTIEALKLHEEETSEQEGPRGFSDIITNLVGTKNHDFKGQNSSDYLSDLTNKVSQLKDEAEANQ